MAKFRTTAVQTFSRDASHFGGTNWDAPLWASMFNKSEPQHLGVFLGNTFASSTLDGDMVNNKWLWLTAAQGRIYNLEPGKYEYSWNNVARVDPFATITRCDYNPGEEVGISNSTFYLYCDKPWFVPPVLLKLESNTAPRVRILDVGVPISDYEWRYTCKLQTGLPSDFIYGSLLSEGMKVRDGGTSVSVSGNYDYAGDYYGGGSECKSHITYFARKAEFDDHFLRLEVAGKGGGSFRLGNQVFNENSISTLHHVYQRDLKDKTKANIIKPGTMVTNIEARLEQMISRDKELSMEWGRTEMVRHPKTGKLIPVAAGWNQIREEGNYFTHNGTLSIYDLQDLLYSVVGHRAPMGTNAPKYVLSTGRLGIQYFHQMVNAANAANPFTLVDSFFVSGVSSGIHGNSLALGAQFVEYRGLNGATITVMEDPNADNPEMYPELIPGTMYTKRSFSYELISLSETASAPNGMSINSNVAMVWEPAYSEYFTKSNVYDFSTGLPIKNGGNAHVLDKEVGVYRACSAALAVFDVEDTMVIDFLA